MDVKKTPDMKSINGNKKRLPRRLIELNDARNTILGTPPAELKKQMYRYMRDIDDLVEFHKNEISCLVEVQKEIKEDKNVQGLERALHDAECLLMDSKKETSNVKIEQTELQRVLVARELELVTVRKECDLQVSKLKLDLKRKNKEVDDLLKDKNDFDYHIDFLTKKHNRKLEEMKDVYMQSHGEMTEIDLNMRFNSHKLQDELIKMSSENTALKQTQAQLNYKLEELQLREEECRRLKEETLELELARNQAEEDHKKAMEELKHHHDELEKNLAGLAAETYNFEASKEAILVAENLGTLLNVSIDQLLDTVRGMLESSEKLRTKLKVVETERDQVVTALCAKTLEMSEEVERLTTELNRKDQELVKVNEEVKQKHLELKDKNAEKLQAKLKAVETDRDQVIATLCAKTVEMDREMEKLTTELKEKALELSEVKKRELEQVERLRVIKPDQDQDDVVMFENTAVKQEVTEKDDVIEDTQVNEVSKLLKQEMIEEEGSVTKECVKSDVEVKKELEESFSSCCSVPETMKQEAEDVVCTGVFVRALVEHKVMTEEEVTGLENGDVLYHLLDKYLSMAELYATVRRQVDELQDAESKTLDKYNHLESLLNIDVDNTLCNSSFDLSSPELSRDPLLFDSFCQTPVRTPVRHKRRSKIFLPCETTITEEPSDTAVVELERVLDDKNAHIANLEKRILKLEDVSAMFHSETERIREAFRGEMEMLNATLKAKTNVLTDIRNKLMVETVSLKPELQSEMDSVNECDLLAMFIQNIMASCQQLHDDNQMLTKGLDEANTHLAASIAALQKEVNTKMQLASKLLVVEHDMRALQHQLAQQRLVTELGSASSDETTLRLESDQQYQLNALRSVAVLITAQQATRLQQLNSLNSTLELSLETETTTSQQYKTKLQELAESLAARDQSLAETQSRLEEITNKLGQAADNEEQKAKSQAMIQQAVDQKTEEIIALRKEVQERETKLNQQSEELARLERLSIALQEKLDAHNEAIAELDTELKTVQDKFTCLQEEINKKGAELVKKNQEVTRLEKLSINLQEELDVKKEAREKLEAELKTVQGRVTSLQEIVDEKDVKLTQESEELKRLLSEQEEVSKKLQKELEETEEAKANLKTVQDQVTALQKEVNEKDAKMNNVDFERVLSEQKKLSIMLQEELEETKKSKRQLEAELDKITALQEEKNCESEKQKSELTRLLSEQEKLSKENEAKRKREEQKKEEIKADNAELLLKLSFLEQQFSELETKLQVQTAEREIENLEMEHKLACVEGEIETLRRTLQSEKNKIKELETEKRTLEGDLNEEKARIKELEKESKENLTDADKNVMRLEEELKETKKELDEERNKYTRVNAEVVSLECVVEELKQSHCGQEKTLHGIAAALDQLEIENNCLRAASGASEELEKKYLTLSEELNSLTADWSRKQLEFQQKQQETKAKAAQEVEKLNVEIVDLKVKLDDANAAKQSFEELAQRKAEELEQLQAELEEQKNNLNRLQETYEVERTSLLTEIEQLRSEISKEAADNKHLQDDLVQARSQVDSLLESDGEAKRKLQVKVNEVMRMESSNKVLETENYTLKETVDKLQAEIVEIQCSGSADVDHLKTEMETLKHVLSQTEQEKASLEGCVKDLEEKNLVSREEGSLLRCKLAKSEEDLVALNNRFEQLRQEDVVLKETIVTLNVEIRELRAQNEITQLKNKDLANCLTEATTNAKEQEGQLSEAQLMLSSVGAENIKDAINELLSKLEWNVKENVKKDSQMDALRSDMVQAQSETKQKCKETEELVEMISSLNSVIRRLETKVTELESAQGSLQELLLEKTSIVSSLKKELAEVEQNNTSLLKILLEVQKSLGLPDCTILNDLEHCHGQFVKQITQLQSQVRKAEERLLTLKAAEDDNTKLKEKVTTLEAKLEGSKSRTHALNNRRMDKLEELNRALNETICRIITITKLANPDRLNFFSVRSYDSSSKTLIDHITGMMEEMEDLMETNKKLDEECEDQAKFIKEMEKEKCEALAMLEEAKAGDRTVRKKSDVRRLEKLEDVNNTLTDVLRNLAKLVDVPEAETVSCATVRAVESLGDKVATAVKNMTEEVTDLKELNRELDDEIKTMTSDYKKEEVENLALLQENLRLKEELAEKDATQLKLLSEGCQCGSEVKELKTLLSLRETRIADLQEFERQHNTLKSQVNYLENALDRANKKCEEEREKSKKLETESRLATGPTNQGLRMRGSLSGGLVQETVDKETMRNLAKQNQQLKELCRARAEENKQLKSELKLATGATNSPLRSNQHLANSPFQARSYNTRSRLAVESHPGGKRFLTSDKENL